MYSVVARSQVLDGALANVQNPVDRGTFSRCSVSGLRQVLLPIPVDAGLCTDSSFFIYPFK